MLAYWTLYLERKEMSWQLKKQVARKRERELPSKFLYIDLVMVSFLCEVLMIPVLYVLYYVIHLYSRNVFIMS